MARAPFVGRNLPTPIKGARIILQENTRKTGLTILILEASVGSGHTRAAQAVEAALKIENPSATVEVRDILDGAGWFYRSAYRSFYLSLARHAPRILDILYDWSDAMPSWVRRFLLFLDRRAFRDFVKGLLDSPPDLIVCTHFLPLEILAGLRLDGTLSGPVWGVVTDIHPHGIWIYEGIDRYIVPTALSAYRLALRKIPPTEVRVTGLPVHPDFSNREAPNSLREKWNLPDRLTVLLLSGGHGVGSLIPVLDSFLDCALKVTLIAVAGKNRALLDRYRRWAVTHETPDLSVLPLGYVPNMHEWMGLSDVVVTKPGGLSVFESLAMEKPLVLLPPRGGQEKKNLEAVVVAGAGIAVQSPGHAGPVVRTLVMNPGLLETLSANARRLGKPDAARTLARMIVGIPAPEEKAGRRASGMVVTH